MVSLEISKVSYSSEHGLERSNRCQRQPLSLRLFNPVFELGKKSARLTLQRVR
jgi:hypothetical protein